MYYYIFEQPRNANERAYFERIRDVAREFSIYGEITQSSPARSPGELTQMAINKNYTTIVGIGSDEHINKIVAQIINQNPPFTVALGIISVDPNSMLYERWGFKKPEEACETLKYRLLERFDVGLIEPNHYFLTSARIECSKPSRIILEVDRWKAEAIIDRAEISGNLYILLETFKREKSVIKTAINWLVGQESTTADRSIFKAKIVRISSYDPLPVMVSNEVVAQTPINIYRKPNALNIICRRDKLSNDYHKETVSEQSRSSQ